MLLRKTPDDFFAFDNFLHNANPEWTKNDVAKVKEKLSRVGIDGIDSLSKGVMDGSVNAKLRRNKERIFTQDTIQAMRRQGYVIHKIDKGHESIRQVGQHSPMNRLTRFPGSSAGRGLSHTSPAFFRQTGQMGGMETTKVARGDPEYMRKPRMAASLPTLRESRASNSIQTDQLPRIGVARRGGVRMSLAPLEDSRVCDLEGASQQGSPTEASLPSVKACRGALSSGDTEDEAPHLARPRGNTAEDLSSYINGVRAFEKQMQFRNPRWRSARSRTPGTEATAIIKEYGELDKERALKRTVRENSSVREFTTTIIHTRNAQAWTQAKDVEHLNFQRLGRIKKNLEHMARARRELTTAKAKMDQMIFGKERELARKQEEDEKTKELAFMRGTLTSKVQENVTEIACNDIGFS
mmetsp:Transcript_46682/g.101482  ORF Transcript_46682/g.101482 Transcript_46682/m.101482 type:complete len:410 (+) Transcript_46682:55-1284(+)|eukprot:CAMPEP_0204258802 /NCGR_PEP_ID=MMETSP0468-20130131/5171_1 /ASSEMBLY_ACC=CAM_ASM_000383 /TAXON_ID=2969 /ORGANISM="Oxyrrhis marina" /LENGTH=409 /DNA_ID=CAMNT_0051233003 /DNA_START=11 /DNA_END=1240 /DNA_ORIENTATION=-